MNTDFENWVEAHPEEYDFMQQVKWLRKKFPKVADQYVAAVEEHADGCKNDPYYRYTCGGGTVPFPCCLYCTEYDGDRCHIRWNNNDESYYNPDLDDKEADDLCEHYEWSGEWEGEQ